MDTGPFQDNLACGKGTIQLGGTTYLVNKPSDADGRAIAAYLRKNVKSPVAMLQADPDFAFLPDDVRKEKLAEAAGKKFSQGEALDPVSAFEELTSVHGCRFMFWLLARKNHPELTLESCTDLITDANVARVFIELDEATGMSPLGPRAGPPG